MHFTKPLDAGRPEGLWQKLVMSTAGIGYYNHGDSIDVHFHREDGSGGGPLRQAGRADRMSFEPLVDLPAAHEPDALAFAFSADRMLAREGLPLTAAELDGLEPLPLGRLDGRLCLAYELPDDYEPGPGLELEHLRALWGRLDDPLWTLAGRALQTVAWYRDNAFCGRCGTATERLAGERARGCPNCGLAAYPRLAPAVIVLIERDGAALLCHGVRFPGKMYSCLAGFVEPGESIEECVHREIREEAGIEVTDLRYAGVAAVAVPALADGRVLRHVRRRRAAARPVGDRRRRLVPPDDLPALPPYPSIARRLIDEWLARQGRQPHVSSTAASTASPSSLSTGAITRSAVDPRRTWMSFSAASGAITDTVGT